MRLSMVLIGLSLFWGVPLVLAQEESGKRIVYPKKTELDFEGIEIDGELRNPGEFYFEVRKREKFKSLVTRRKNFHREMLRDAVMSR